MVTDQEFKAVLSRLEDLERQFKALSRSLAEHVMRSNATTYIKQDADVKTKRDTTKYFFMGRKYNKRNLVLAVINQFVADRSVRNSIELQHAFPDYIQGSLGVIKKVEEAEKYASSSQRFFFDDDKVLAFEDGMYAICKDWEAKNISRFIRKASEYGYLIESITVSNGGI